jgi:hypothetical protein
MPLNGSETLLTLDTSPQAMSTSAQSLTSAPMKSSTITKPTSSLESADGHSLLDLLDGQMIAPRGQAPVHVSRFRARDNTKAMPTNDTSGPLFTASSPSAALQLSLENRLRIQMGANGSPAFVLTWKHWDMPAGPPICALRASERLMRDSAFIGWQTPRARGDAGGRAWRRGHAKRLEDQARIFALNRGLKEEEVAQLSLSVTFSRRLMGYPIEWHNCMPSETPSFLRSRRNSSVQP